MDDSRTVGNVRREGVTWTYGVDGVHTTVTPGGRRNGSPGNVHGTHTGRTSQGSAARTACPYRARRRRHPDREPPPTYRRVREDH